MKNIFVYPLFLVALSASAGVVQSGNWTSTSTWSGGVVPTATSASQMDSLSFDSAALNLNIDTANVYVKQLALGSTASQTITVAAGNTITFSGTGTDGYSQYVFGSSVSASPFPSATFNGDGIVKFALAKGNSIAKGTYTFNAKVSNTGGTIYFYNNSVVNVNNTWSSGSLQFTGSATLNVNSDMNVWNLNGWNNSATLNVAEGKTFTGQYLSFTKANINGTIKATASNGGEYYTIALGRANDGTTATINIGAKAQVISESTSNQMQIRNSKLTINSAAKSITSNSKILLTRADITLNSSGVFSISGSDQRDSILDVGSIVYSGTQQTVPSTNVKITLNADNDFGGFRFWGNSTNSSTLTINTNGHNMNMGAMILNDGATDLNIVLNQLEDFIVKINDIANIGIYETDEGLMRAAKVKVYDSEGMAFDAEGTAFVLAASDGTYWLNYSSVPEPATVAAVFALFALALAIYRRRAK